MTRSLAVFFLVPLALGGCAPSPAPAPAPGPVIVSPEPEAPPPAAAPVQHEPPAVKATPGDSCGALGCQRFSDAKSAFANVMAKAPLVLAVGEAHAQRGAAEVPSATQRFTEELLPMLEGEASDLVLELMVADGSCGQVEAKTAAVQKPVVERQAEGNQNEFIALGKAAEKVNIRPHILKPRCEDYQAVAKAGPDGIPQMLSMIAELSNDLIRRILARNEREAKRATVLAYGGAIHNDVAPRAGREAWSFGPSLMKDTKGRYVELDIIVPEFIKDNETWRALPWYDHFEAHGDPSRVTLYETAPRSYTLIFARTSKSSAK